MRKIVWWSSAGVIAAVSLGALTAAYACRNPESPLGRFVFACYDLDAAYNPMHRVAALTGQHVAGGVRQATGIGEAGCCDSGADACVGTAPAEPKPLEVAVAPGLSDVEVRPECRVSGKIVIEDEAERTAAAVSSAAEESEEPVLVMPPANDSPIANNQRMPYADEEPAAAEETNFFASLWEKLTAWRVNLSPTTSGGEESEEHAPPVPSARPMKAGGPGVKMPFDEVQPKTDVDTTEFRPSDAGRYGFGRPMPY